MKARDLLKTLLLPVPVFIGAALLSLSFGEGITTVYLPIPVGIALTLLWGPLVLVPFYLVAAGLAPLFGFPAPAAWLMSLGPTCLVALVAGLYRLAMGQASVLSSSRSFGVFIGLGLAVPTSVAYLIFLPLAPFFKVPLRLGDTLPLLHIISENLAVISILTPITLFLFEHPKLKNHSRSEKKPLFTHPFLIQAPFAINLAALITLYMAITVAAVFLPVAQFEPLFGFLMLGVALRYGFGHTLLVAFWTVVGTVLLPHAIGHHPGTQNLLNPVDVVGDFTMVIMIWFVLLTGRILSQLRAETISREISENTALKVAMRHHAVLNALPDMVFRLTAEGLILEAHSGSPDDFYLPPSQFIGKTLVETMPPNLGPRMTENVARASQGEPNTFEYELPVKGGTKRFEARYRPGSDGEVVAVVRDITDLYKARLDLESSEARYRLLFDESPLGIAILDQLGLVRAANKTARLISGYPAKSLGELHRDHLASDPEQMFLAIKERQEKGHFQGEYALRRADGKVIPTYIHTFTVAMPGGGNQICVMFEDLRNLQHLKEERDQGRDLLREAEITGKAGAFRLVWDQAPPGQNAPSRIYFSPGAKTLLMLSPDSENSLADFESGLEPGDLARFQAQMQGALQSGRAELSLSRRVANSPYRHFEVIMWLDNKVPSGVSLNGLLRDVTESHHLHETLEEYRTLFHLSTEPFAILNLGGQVLEINPALSGITGRPSHALVGQNLLDLIADPAEREQVSHRFADSLRLGTFISGLAVGLGVRGGGVHRMLLNLTPDMAGGKAYVVLADVQELESARKLASENQNRFVDLFTRMPAAFALHSVTWGPDGEAVDYRFLLVNPGFETLTGLKAEAVVGRSVRLVLPDTETFWIQTYGRVVKTGESLTFTQYSKAIDKYFTVHAYKAREGQFATVFFDITESVKAEDSRRLMEQRLAILMSSLDAVVWEANSSGQFTYINIAVERLTGFPVSKWLDPQFHRTRLHPDDLEKWVDAFMVDEGIKQNRVVEYRLRHKEGHYFWVRNHIRPALEEDRVVGLRGVWVDVSDAHAVHSELERRESRFLAVATTMSEGLVIQDEMGQILDCNFAAERILGLTRDQMAGRTSTDPRWRCIREDGSPFPGSEHPAMVTLATGEPQLNQVMGVYKTDGSLSWILINSHLIEDAYSRNKQVVATFRDITESRQSFQQLSHELEHRQRGLARARELQEQLGHRALPLHPAFDLQGAFIPSEEVAGDFIRLHLLGQNRLLIIMADCTGHGVEASIMAVLLGRDCDSLLPDVERHGDPAAILTELNLRMNRLDLEGHYPALMAAVIDIPGRSLTWANAGGEAPLKMNPGGVSPLPRAPGMYLGFDSSIVFENRRCALNPDDILLFCSDALLELKPNTPVSPDLLSPRLGPEVVPSASNYLAGVLALYKEMRGSSPHDDISALVFRFTKPWASPPFVKIDPEEKAFREALEKAALAGWSPTEAEDAKDTLCQWAGEVTPAPGPYVLHVDGQSMTLQSPHPAPSGSPWKAKDRGSAIEVHRKAPLVCRSL